MIRKLAAVVALATLATLATLAGCDQVGGVSDAEEIRTQFEIIGPEGTLVEITQIQNGEEQDKTEGVLKRNNPSDKDAKFVLEKKILTTWAEGYRITARVTLTADGKDSEQAVTAVGLECIVNRLDTNSKVGSATGQGSVTCAADYKE